MIFITIGFFICDYQDKLKPILKYIPFLMILSSGLLIGEGVLLYNVYKLDMNFLIMLIPFSFFFFIYILSSSIISQFDTRKIRELSKYYYFVHPVCIVIIEEFGKAFGLNIFSSGIISLLVIILLTHILSLMIISIQQNSIRYLNIFFAAICGLLITFVLAGLFFQFKCLDILVKFEFVPCLWFLTTFSVYYLFFRRSKQGSYN